MRIRFTTHMPIEGNRIGLTVWWGSVADGWTGKPLFRRGITYRITGVLR